jgi:spore coat protein U-like protein
MNCRRAFSVNKAAMAACLLLLAEGAMAATICRLQSGGSTDFGPYDTFVATPADTTATVQVRCERDAGPQNISITLGLSAGANGTSVTNRRMLQAGGAGDYLNYGLFRDVGRSSPWGFTAGVDAVTQIVSVPNKDSTIATFTIYGRIPARQNVSVGTYTDRIQVTLTP